MSKMIKPVVSGFEANDRIKVYNDDSVSGSDGNLEWE